MKFGIFYEHQLPRPWTERAEYEQLQNSLDEVELADRLGYDFAWEVEHHFLEEYSHSSAPEVFLAAASQRTQKIRLAHGIIQLTTNHPARVAERVSTLDLLSHGRVEFGIGEGSSITELHPFDRRFRDKRAVWEDAVRAIIPMFSSHAHEYHGEYFDFPLRNVLPKPFQKPHPPLWVACSQIDTIEMAGRRGMGALGFQFVSAEAAEAWVPYGGKPGLNHLGFEVEDVVGLRERLREAGYRESTVPNDHPHRTRVYFRDAEGNDWEFVQYLSDAPAERNDYALPDF